MTLGTVPRLTRAAESGSRFRRRFRWVTTRLVLTSLRRRLAPRGTRWNSRVPLVSRRPRSRTRLSPILMVLLGAWRSCLTFLIILWIRTLLPLMWSPLRKRVVRLLPTRIFSISIRRRRGRTHPFPRKRTSFVLGVIITISWIVGRRLWRILIIVRLVNILTNSLTNTFTIRTLLELYRKNMVPRRKRLVMARVLVFRLKRVSVTLLALLSSTFNRRKKKTLNSTCGTLENGGAAPRGADLIETACMVE